MFFILLILIIAFGAQIFLRFFNHKKKIILFGKRFGINLFKADFPGQLFFITAAFLILASNLFQGYRQYQLWLKDDIAKYFLPPYQSVNYFIFYILARFFAPYLISLVVAIVFLFFAKVVNKRRQNLLFYPEEPYFGALAIFLTGYPGWIFYLVSLILVYLLIHICSLFIVHGSSLRISLYWLWLPTAIFVIIIQKWLELLTLWNLLKI